MVDYTNRNTEAAAGIRGSASVNQGLRDYMIGIYKNMAAGVGLTGVIAYMVAQSPTLMQAIYGTPLQWLVMLAPLGFVLFMGFRIEKMSVSGATTAFYAFSALMGLSLAYIFAIYTGESIARTFFIVSAMFGGMSLWGYTTKRDLTGMGQFLFMGLIGIVIASIVNIFLGSTQLQFIVSVLGVIIFTGLTAYDTQRLKRLYYVLQGDRLKKAAIMGALSLYLDFINLMIMMLQFVGDRR